MSVASSVKESESGGVRADGERENAVSPFMDDNKSHYTGHRVSHGYDPDDFDVPTEDPRVATLLPVVPP